MAEEGLEFWELEKAQKGRGKKRTKSFFFLPSEFLKSYLMAELKIEKSSIGDRIKCKLQNVNHRW